MGKRHICVVRMVMADECHIDLLCDATQLCLSHGYFAIAVTNIECKRMTLRLYDKGEVVELPDSRAFLRPISGSQVCQSASNALLKEIGHGIQHGRFAQVKGVIHRRQRLYTDIGRIYAWSVCSQRLIHPVQCFDSPAAAKFDDISRYCRIPDERIEQPVFQCLLAVLILGMGNDRCPRDDC